MSHSRQTDKVRHFLSRARHVQKQLFYNTLNFKHSYVGLVSNVYVLSLAATKQIVAFVLAFITFHTFCKSSCILLTHFL
jgi:hypothetical protein